MSTKATGPATPLDESVRVLARSGDPDRYVAALLAPRAIRDDLIVLAAFSGEIGRIPGLVREPMMGELRYQWWRDQLAALDRAEPTGNPLADALGDIIRRHRLPLGLVEGIIDASAGDLRHDLPADDGELASRHARGDGALFELAAIIHGLERTTALDEACADAGLVLALARGLSRVPWHLAHGGLPVTKARLAAAGLDPAQGLPGPDDVGLQAALDGIRELARACHERLGTRLGRLPRAALAPLLPVAMLKPYLAAQTRIGSDAKRVLAQPTPLARAWALWRARRRGVL